MNTYKTPIHYLQEFTFLKTGVYPEENQIDTRFLNRMVEYLKEDHDAEGNQYHISALVEAFKRVDIEFGEADNAA